MSYLSFRDRKKQSFPSSPAPSPKVSFYRRKSSFVNDNEVVSNFESVSQKSLIKDYSEFKVSDFSIRSLSAANALDTLRPTSISGNVDASLDAAERAIDAFDSASNSNSNSNPTV